MLAGDVGGVKPLPPGPTPTALSDTDLSLASLLVLPPMVSWSMANRRSWDTRPCEEPAPPPAPPAPAPAPAPPESALLTALLMARTGP